MKTIVLYARRNVGLCALSYLIAKGFKVKVMSDSEDILWMAHQFRLKIVSFDTMGDFDLFLCVHGNKIIDKKYLVDKKMCNVHPCLWKYRGASPIKRYILNEDNEGTVESQYLIEEVDGGEVIHREDFYTGKCSTFADFYNVALPYYFKCIDATLEKLL